MPKDTMERPDRQGEIGAFCPCCKKKHNIEVPTVAREQKGTGKLYFGCPNFKLGCRFNGCRDKKD
jgi:hypothetical protein